MKYIKLLLLTILAFLAACSGGGAVDIDEPTETPVTADAAAPSGLYDYPEGAFALLSPAGSTTYADGLGGGHLVGTTAEQMAPGCWQVFEWDAQIVDPHGASDCDGCTTYFLATIGPRTFTGCTDEQAATARASSPYLVLGWSPADQLMHVGEAAGWVDFEPWTFVAL